jgi:hypothetical protein
MERFRLNGKYEYCPNGNYWSEISGIFDKEIYLFCDCNKCNGKVYKLKPFDITKKVPKASIDKWRKFEQLESLREKVTLENMDKVKKLLD